MNNTIVIKRNGEEVGFDKTKIENAILKAMKFGSGIVHKNIAKEISDCAEHDLVERLGKKISIYDIEKFVFNALIEYGQNDTARAYENYRTIREVKRQENTTDDTILSLIDLKNEDVMNENSNKSAVLLSTQRDLIAGEVSKDIAKRKLIPSHIIQAHEDGAIHWHKQNLCLY